MVFPTKKQLQDRAQFPIHFHSLSRTGAREGEGKVYVQEIVLYPVMQFFSSVTGLLQSHKTVCIAISYKA